LGPDRKALAGPAANRHLDPSGTVVVGAAAAPAGQPFPEELPLQGIPGTGRTVRTITLLRFLSEPALRQQITAITNRVEAFHGFAA
jgi:hypothetical protein